MTIPIYQLKITLKHTKTFRTVLVFAETNFETLHGYIQAIFQFENYHLWVFRYDNKHKIQLTPKYLKLLEDKYETISPDELRDFNISPKYEEEGYNDNTDFYADQVGLDAFLVNPKDKIMYEYDFGDSWEFEILLEKIWDWSDHKTNAEIKKAPCLIKAKGLSCLEDIGGIGMYFEYQEILATEKLDANQKEYLGYMKDRFEIGERSKDPKARILAKWEKISTLEYLQKEFSNTKKQLSDIKI
jgi:Plasmid pRiA4b ORF-3-like protein